jgi:hypothetical protein
VSEAEVTGTVSVTTAPSSAVETTVVTGAKVPVRESGPGPGPKSDLVEGAGWGTLGL